MNHPPFSTGELDTLFNQLFGKQRVDVTAARAAGGGQVEVCCSRHVRCAGCNGAGDGEPRLRRRKCAESGRSLRPDGEGDGRRAAA